MTTTVQLSAMLDQTFLLRVSAYAKPTKCLEACGIDISFATDIWLYQAIDASGLQIGYSTGMSCGVLPCR